MAAVTLRSLTAGSVVVDAVIAHAAPPAAFSMAARLQDASAAADLLRPLTEVYGLATVREVTMTSLPSPPPPEDLKILGVPMPTNDVGLAGLFLGSTGLFTGLLTALVVYLMARRCRHNGADPDGVKPDESTLNAGASQALTIDSSQVDVMLHLGQMSLGDADDTPPATNSESAATTIWGRTWAGPLLTTPRTDSPRGSGHVGGAGDVAGPSRSAPTLQGGAELASHPMEPVAEDGNPGETVVIGEATGVGADSSMYGCAHDTTPLRCFVGAACMGLWLLKLTERVSLGPMRLHLVSEGPHAERLPVYALATPTDDAGRLTLPPFSARA